MRSHGVALPGVGGTVLGRHQLVDTLSGQLPVSLERPDVKVNITVGLVAMSAVDDALDQPHDSRDVAGRPRFHCRTQAPEQVVGVGEGPLVGGRDRPPWPPSISAFARILSSMSVTFRANQTS